jgi:hypothetical protein
MTAKEEITLVFRLNSIDIGGVLQRIESVLSNEPKKLTGFMLFDQPVGDLREAYSRLQISNRTTFHLVGLDYDLVFGRLTSYEFEFLSIKQNRPTDRIRCDDWVAPFITGTAFVMAWVADSEYQFWQNAHDPLQYRAAGRSFDHLPQKSNGLPYPLEQTIIDISANPGRRLVRKGYYEAVGALMWLGELFWAMTGASRSRLEDLDWLQVSFPHPSVARVQALAGMFREDTGHSREDQEKLRAILFPNTLSV